MSDIRAWRQALAASAGLWQTWADELAGAARSLLTADTGSAGDRVQPALEGFLDHWATRLRALAASAESNADALGDVWGPLEASDREAVTRLRGLLPFGSPSPLAQARPPQVAPGGVDLERVWGGP